MRQMHRMRIYRIRVLPTSDKVIWYSNKIGQEFFAYLTIKYDKCGTMCPCFRLCDYIEDDVRIFLRNICLDILPENCQVVGEFMGIGPVNHSEQKQTKKYKFEKYD